MSIALLWIFAGLQFADAYTTMKILSKGGVELNPVMAWIFKKAGIMNGLFMVKTVMVAFFAYFIDRIPAWLMGVLCIAYAWVVYHNARQLRK